MFAGEKINELAERKELLLAQSHAHRLLIQLEYQRLRASIHSLNPLAARPGGGARYDWLLASASAIFSLRTLNLARWVLRGLDAFRLVRRLFGKRQAS